MPLKALIALLHWACLFEEEVSTNKSQHRQTEETDACSEDYNPTVIYKDILELFTLVPH